MQLQADAEALARREGTTTKPGICLLTETYYPVIGGGETQARVLAEDLVANGFRVTVVTRRSSKALSKVEQLGGVTVHRTFPIGGGQLKRWAMIFTCLPVLLSRRRLQRPRVSAGIGYFRLSHRERSIDLYDATQRLITDASLAGSLGRAALLTARARYAREVVLAKYIELFNPRVHESR